MTTDTFMGMRLTGNADIDFDEALTLFPEHTFVMGDTQVTLLPMPDRPDALYLANCVTRPHTRRKGGFTALMDIVYAMADEDGVTICSHPDSDWLERRMLKRGYVYDESMAKVGGRPFMFRPPRARE